MRRLLPGPVSSMGSWAVEPGLAETSDDLEDVAFRPDMPECAEHYYEKDGDHEAEKRVRFEPEDNFHVAPTELLDD